MIEKEGLQPQKSEEKHLPTHGFDLWGNDREKRIVETVMNIGITATKVGISAVALDILIRVTLENKLMN